MIVIFRVVCLSSRPSDPIRVVASSEAGFNLYILAGHENSVF